MPAPLRTSINICNFFLSLRYIYRVRRFRAFYVKHKDAFFSYLMRRTADYDLAGDILQESFARYLERYGKDSDNAALLYTIGRNLIYDHYRRKTRNAGLQPDENPVNNDQEHHYLVREKYRRVLDAMGTLENDERDILALAVSGDLSYREISVIAGISEANVKVKVHRARLKLRKIMQAGER